MSFSVEGYRRDVICRHRAEMSDEDNQKEERLKDAHSSVVGVMIENIKDAVMDALDSDPFIRDTIIKDPHEGADLHGLNYLTVLKGTYRKSSGKRDWK